MKINGKIVLFISITIFALIICLFYLNRIYLYTNIVENFASSQQYYKKQLPYVNEKVIAPTVYNDDVLNNNLPIIYDVDPKNVNLCYGDNKNSNSLYTFPYIILILRLYHLVNNSGITSKEYKDLCTVLTSINNSSSGTNGPIIITNNSVNTNNLTRIYNYIIQNSRNKKALLKPPSNIGNLYGKNLIKSCSRLYPNWLMNPTNPTNSKQIKLQPFPFINNGNENQFADFYVKGTVPGGTSLFPKRSKNPIAEPVLSITTPPSTNVTDANILPQGAKNNSFRLDKFNFQNKNNEYCKRNKANTDPSYNAIEWTNEFALQNNISKSVEEYDVCLKLLLNPLTGDIIKCNFVQFNNKTLTFIPIDNNKQQYIYANMLQLYDNSTEISTGKEGQKTWGFRATPFKGVKLNKYVFDDCGRLYSVPTSVAGEFKFPTTFDLTQIFANKDNSKDFYSVIKYYSSIVSTKPVPTYNIINEKELEKITSQLIDNTITLAEFYTNVLYDSFTPSLFKGLTTDTLDVTNHSNKSNVNGTFSYYFMRPATGNDVYSNITNYTSSDGFVYINLGNIPGEINKDGKTFTSGIDSSINKNIKSGITPSLLSNIQKLIMDQIIENSVIINTNIKNLQDLQTRAYNTINTIYYYLMGNGLQSGIFGYLSLFPIPILSDIQVTAAESISTSDGKLTNNVTSDTYKTAQNILNEYKPTGNIVNIDKNNYLYDKNNYPNSILGIFGNLIGSATTQNPRSLFNKDNVTKLVGCTSKLEQIYDHNNTNYPNNLVTAKKFVSVIFKSLTSLIQFKNYIIGIDAQNLFNDQTQIQAAWNALKWAQAQFAIDWDNYVATNPNWNRGGNGSQNNSDTISFPPAPSQGQSLSTVLSNIAQSASLNVPGLSNTVTNNRTLNETIQLITEEIKDTRQASTDVMGTLTNLGANITNIYYG